MSERYQRFENVHDCPDCEGEHNGLRFDPLPEPICTMPGQLVHWSALCPSTGYRLLFFVHEITVYEIPINVPALIAKVRERRSHTVKWGGISEVSQETHRD